VCRYLVSSIGVTSDWTRWQAFNETDTNICNDNTKGFVIGSGTDASYALQVYPVSGGWGVEISMGLGGLAAGVVFVGTITGDIFTTLTVTNSAVLGSMSQDAFGNAIPTIASGGTVTITPI
jgi:hypothetical protein